MQTFIPSPSQGVWHLGPLPLRAYAFAIIVGSAFVRPMVQASSPAAGLDAVAAVAADLAAGVRSAVRAPR